MRKVQSMADLSRYGSGGDERISLRLPVQHAQHASGHHHHLSAGSRMTASPSVPSFRSSPLQGIKEEDRSVRDPAFPPTTAPSFFGDDINLGDDLFQLGGDFGRGGDHSGGALDLSMADLPTSSDAFALGMKAEGGGGGAGSSGGAPPDWNSPAPLAGEDGTAMGGLMDDLLNDDVFGMSDKAVFGDMSDFVDAFMSPGR